MRDTYHEDLAALTRSLVAMATLVGAAVGQATQALLGADLVLAEQVIAGDAGIDEQDHQVEARAFDLLARQGPVAGDLRVVVSALRMTSELERSGGLAVHVAELARRRYPTPAVPVPLHGTVLRMGQLAQGMTVKAGNAIDSRDLELCAEIERDDDEVDALHRSLFQILLADDWHGDVEATIDVTLCGRFYERIADHAVSVARRVSYLVTGQQPVATEQVSRPGR